jgi:hypothetical protein
MMSVGPTTEAQGIDFIDFVKELWRAKWIFAITLIGVAGCAFLAFMIMERVAPTRPMGASEQSHFAYFLYRSDVQLDPFGRERTEILAELLDKFALVDTIGVVGERDFMTGDIVPDHRFYIRPSSEHSGRIGIEVKGDHSTLHEQIREQFVDAARLQAEAIKARAIDELAMLNELSKDVYDKPSELIADNIYRVMRFLDNRAVKAGTFRYFEFLPLQSYPPAAAPPAQSSSVKRSLAISVLFGLIVACIAVLFRMEARRRHLLRSQR